MTKQTETEALTQKERDVLTHTLTGSVGTAASRNRYTISKGHHAEKEVKSLVKKGLMVPGHTMLGSTRYHCTAAGAEAVNLRLPV